MDLSFLNMIDTPDSYTNKAGHGLIVKDAEDGLEFVEPGTAQGGLGSLGGTANSFTMNTTTSTIQGYSEMTDKGLFQGNVNATTGVITIPKDGQYFIIFHLYGTQGNNTKEEMMRLLAGVDSNDVVVDLFDVATDKTDERAFNASFLVPNLTDGQQITMRANATAGMGTFTVLQCDFAVLFLQP